MTNNRPARIIDAHAYCFKPADDPAGHESGAAHLRWLQAAHASHHQPAWRVRDRTPASSQPLAPEGAHRRDLPDVDFRVDRHRGRVLWTVDGEDFTKQFYPPNLHDLQFTAHSLIAEMDYAGVELALLHTDPMLGREAAYQAECVRLYPDRLRAMAPVDEWRIRTETETVCSELETAISRHRLQAIKFIPQLAYLDSRAAWHTGPYEEFWSLARSLKVPVFFTLGCGPQGTKPATVEQQTAGYLRELAILVQWMERYADIPCSLTHGFPWRLFVDGNQIRLPSAIWEPFQNPNLHLEVSFPVRLGDLFDYPYRSVWPTLEEMVDRIGAERLLWGTDMPFQNRFCTYRQSLDWIQKLGDFLAPQQRDLILGETAAKLLRLDG